MLAFLKSDDVLFLVLGLLQVMDVVTGLISVHKRGVFDSKKLSAGIAKKIGDWFFVAMAFLASYILVRIGALFPEFSLESSRTLGWLVLATMLYKEFRSVFDNLQCLGMSIPPILSKTLLLAEKDFDGVLSLPTLGADGVALKLNKDLDQLAESDTIHVKVQK